MFKYNKQVEHSLHQISAALENLQYFPTPSRETKAVHLQMLVLPIMKGHGFGCGWSRCTGVFPSRSLNVENFTFQLDETLEECKGRKPRHTQTEEQS